MKHITTNHIETVRKLMSLINKSNLPRPAIFPSVDDYTDLVWETTTGRLTIYVKEKEYLLEKIPSHINDDITTQSAQEVYTWLYENI